MISVSNKVDSERILIANDRISRTPAFVYDESVIIDRLAALSDVRRNSACQVLYSIKAAPMRGLLETIANHVDGFSASSLFECQIAKETIGNRGTIHLTTPGLREDEFGSIVKYADYISFNSLNQWQNYQEHVNGELGCGLRINPELSFVKDERYDPCRKYSKLGVPISELENIKRLENIQGLHLHNNCESNDYMELKQTVDHVCCLLGPILERMQWI